MLTHVIEFRFAPVDSEQLLCMDLYIKGTVAGENALPPTALGLSKVQVLFLIYSAGNKETQARFI
jgi:hypothetical protein